MIVNILSGETTLDVMKRRWMAKATAASLGASCLKPFTVCRVSACGTLRSGGTRPVHTPTDRSSRSVPDGINTDFLAPPTLKSSLPQGESSSKARNFGMIYIPYAWLDLDSNRSCNSYSQIRTVANSRTLTSISTDDYIYGWIIVVHPHERIYDRGRKENWGAFWSGDLGRSWEMNPSLLEKIKGRIRRYEAGRESVMF